MRIYKYVMSHKDGGITIPSGSRIIHVNSQGRDICIWAEVDITKPPCFRAIWILPTGEELHDMSATYLGTVHIRDFGLVFHLYEPKE